MCLSCPIGNWETHHYSSLLSAVKQDTADSNISDNRQILKTENIDCNGKRTESDNVHKINNTSDTSNVL